MHLWNTDALVPIFDIDRRIGQKLYTPESSITAIKMTDNTRDDKTV